MTKPYFSKIEFYITNTCNLTCEQCNRFNNYNFRGWQRWSDYEAEYRRWSELIDLKACSIMGGEPLLNPTIVDWVHGINDVFGIEVQILTNGTRFCQAPRGLYEAIAFAKPKSGCRNSIAVSLHNLNDLAEVESDICQFLQGPITQMTQKPEQWGCDHQYVDRNGVMVNVYYQNTFWTASVQRSADGVYTLFDSNPADAHQGCSFVKYKSYHFIAGKLYKCGPAALMPEFDLQYPFDISDQDRELLHSYRPLTPDNFEDYCGEFLQSLENPIAQCKFCPVVKHAIKIAPVRKGYRQ
jgi:hypothetical protein